MHLQPVSRTLDVKTINHAKCSRQRRIHREKKFAISAWGRTPVAPNTFQCGRVPFSNWAIVNSIANLQHPQRIWTKGSPQKSPSKQVFSRFKSPLGPSLWRLSAWPPCPWLVYCLEPAYKTTRCPTQDTKCLSIKTKCKYKDEIHMK